MIEDVGKKGDGVARRGNVIIYVPGAGKGSRVHVKITKRSGNVSFATVTQEAATAR
jgi:predicted RNA-binding protein with TRAM domain